MTTTTELSLIHRFVPATEPGKPPILLLHGTGGDEDDLLPLGRHDRPGLGAALAARQGARRRHAALLPPPRGGRLRRRGRAPPRQRARRLRRPGRARGLQARRRPSRSASRTAPTSPRRCCSFGPRPSPAPPCCGPWCRCRIRPPLTSTGKPVLILSGAMDPIVPAENATRLAVAPEGRRRRSSSTACSRRATA